MNLPPLAQGEPSLADNLRALADNAEGFGIELSPTGNAMLEAIRAMIALNFGRAGEDDVLDAVDAFFTEARMKNCCTQRLH